VPAIASHREIAPKQRERVGIEAVEDVIADLKR